MIELLFLTALNLDTFDQQKLESLLRKIPEAVVSVDQIPNGEKRLYSYPKDESSGFQVKCEANFFLGASYPSSSQCSLTIFETHSVKQDEHKITITDPRVVGDLYAAISEGKELKKFYSNERVYGLKLNGRYGDHFRYALLCNKTKCELSFSTK